MLADVDCRRSWERKAAETTESKSTTSVSLKENGINVAVSAREEEHTH